MGFLVLITHDFKIVRWTLPPDNLNQPMFLHQILVGMGKKSPPGYRRARYVVVDFPEYNINNPVLSDATLIPENPAWVSQGLSKIFKTAQDEFAKVSALGLHNRKALKADPNCVFSSEYNFSMSMGSYEYEDLMYRMGVGVGTAIVRTDIGYGEVHECKFSSSIFTASKTHTGLCGACLRVKRTGRFETLYDIDHSIEWPIKWLSRVNLPNITPENDPDFF